MSTLIKIRCQVCGDANNVYLFNGDVTRTFFLCEKHNSMAERLALEKRETPEHSRRLRGSLLDHLSGHIIYRIVKFEGGDVSEHEKLAIEELREKGVSDDLIFHGWKK